MSEGGWTLLCRHRASIDCREGFAGGADRDHRLGNRRDFSKMPVNDRIQEPNLNDRNVLGQL
jgi:hypothetical protein